MTTGRINQVTTIREILSQSHTHTPSPTKVAERETCCCVDTSLCPQVAIRGRCVSRSPETNLGLESARREIPTSEMRKKIPCPTPLLYGPLLISPRSLHPEHNPPDLHTQTAQPRYIQISIDSGRSALAPQLPQAPLRGEVPARLPAFPPAPQPVYPQVGFVIFLLIEYPYTTLSSPAGRRLSTHAHRVVGSSSSPDIAIRPARPPSSPEKSLSPMSLTHIRVV